MVWRRYPKAIPENREFKKWKFSFVPQRHALWMSFDIFVVTYRVTNFLLKPIHMLLFSMEKTKFPVLVFPYFRVIPYPNTHIDQSGNLKIARTLQVSKNTAIQVEKKELNSKKKKIKKKK